MPAAGESGGPHAESEAQPKGAAVVGRFLQGLAGTDGVMADGSIEAFWGSVACIRHCGLPGHW